MPGRSRVLFDSYDAIADRLLAHPGEWFLVGGGELPQHGVLRQTAYRMQRGLIAAFAPRPGGSFQTRVSSVDLGGDRTRLHDVEVYARWLPAG